MRVPLSWLRDFATFPDDVGLLRATLDDLGLVVEAVDEVGEGLDDVVVARIDEVAAIEGADKIRKVVVEAGQGPLEIVCGAANFVVGDLVPLAPVGAVLPGGFAIAKRKMRGVTSNGMLCSGAELGLGDDHGGLLLLTEVDAAEPGARLVDVLGIERDVVFDVTVEGNRPDAQSISGIARDLAARLGLDFAMPELPAAVVGGPPTAEEASLEVLDPQLSPRFAVALLRNVVVTDSPPKIARRLELAGMRPINNVVDASNYVMLELGQPTHPYDLDHLPGHGLRVRAANPGEALETLDGQRRELGRPGRGLGDAGIDCVICDADDQIVGVAGIMGGASSEISSSTSTVLLEAATFDPIAITRTSRRLALRTEAATRFAKGTDPGILEAAIERFASLVSLNCPEVVLAPAPIVLPEVAPHRRRVVLPLERVRAMLGIELDAAEVAALLGPLGFAVTPQGDGLDVEVPTNRPDVRSGDHGVADLIEEVARAYGYSRLPRRSPSWSAPGRRNPAALQRGTVRQVLCGLGATEAWTESLVPPGDLERLGFEEPEIVVTNPLSTEFSRLRRSLLPGLLRAVGYNAERRADDLALFELGHVFIHPEARQGGRRARAGAAGSGTADLAVEPEVAMALFARQGDDAGVAVAALRLAFDALGIAAPVLEQGPALPGLHPTRSARVLDAVTSSPLGSVGEVDPAVVEALAPGAAGRRIGLLELDLDALGDPGRATRRPEVARMPSRFPSSDVDLAFVLSEEVEAARLVEAVRSAAGALAEDVRLFDVYRGDALPTGARSLAVRVRLCAEDRTLSDAELAEVRSAMIVAGEALGATLR
jgi:phenylalanyl-tRNA synthetase beta chain